MHLETESCEPYHGGQVEMGRLRDLLPANRSSDPGNAFATANVDASYQYGGHYLHHYHRHKQFNLRQTDSSQNIGKPKEATQPQ